MNVCSRVENEPPKSNKALERIRMTLRSFHRLNPSESMEIIQGLETGIITFIHEKHAASSQLVRSDICNKKKPYQTADSKFKRHLKIFHDNGDAEKLITNPANVIKA